MKLLATLNYETGSIQWAEDVEYTAVTFLSFLKKIILSYPVGKTVMVLVNARIHHAKLLEPYLAELGGRLELVFLPPYSPELNLVEGLWKWLKADVINNVFYHSVAQIRKNVHEFMDQISQNPIRIIDRLCIRM